jgi:uncharacterized membrane protein YgcG
VAFKGKNMSVFKKILFFVSFCIAMTGNAALAQAVAAWRVTDATGDVQVLRKGVQLASVSDNMTLQQGDVVATGRKGRAVIARGSEYIMVSPGSRVSLPETQPNGWTWIKQELGNVMFKVQKKSTPHFEVQTPYLAAAVKGTTFSVSVSVTGATVQVTEGAVQVSTIDGLSSQMVRPGGLALVTANAPTQLQMSAPEAAPVPAPIDDSKSAATVESSSAEAAPAEAAPAMVISETIAPEPVSIRAATAGLAREEIVAPVQAAVAVIAPPSYQSPVVTTSAVVESLPEPAPSVVDVVVPVPVESGGTVPIALPPTPVETLPEPVVQPPVTTPVTTTTTVVTPALIGNPPLPPETVEPLPVTTSSNNSGSGSNNSGSGSNNSGSGSNNSGSGSNNSGSGSNNSGSGSNNNNMTETGIVIIGGAPVVDPNVSYTPPAVGPDVIYTPPSVDPNN